MPTLFQCFLRYLIKKKKKTPLKAHEMILMFILCASMKKDLYMTSHAQHSKAFMFPDVETFNTLNGMNTGYP